jgi:hypothetical protein
MLQTGKSKMSNKTEYDDCRYCNKCGERSNELFEKDSIANTVCEYETKCTKCGFKDYWAYGFYESSGRIESKCKKYSF